MKQPIFVRDAEPFISPSGAKVKKGVFLCDCGKEFVAYMAHIRTGNTKSCGCYKRKVLDKIHRKHSMAHTHIYKVWGNMMSRCYNRNHKSYLNYGGRGIKVCDDWRTFEGFKKDMTAGYQEGLSLDRGK